MGSHVDGVTDLIHDGIPDMVVATDKLALAAGAMKEVHRIRYNVDPPIAPAHDDATLRITDFQERRGS
jgi:hypothetical protein